MKSNDCGYDFLDNLEKDGDGFIKRMDAFENYRRSKFQRDQEEQHYNHCVDKKQVRKRFYFRTCFRPAYSSLRSSPLSQCPNCGQLQSYDEWAEKRIYCTGERCSSGSFKYCIPNAFMMERLERARSEATS